MANNSRSLVSGSINVMEDQLLNNPKDVYFQSVLHVDLLFQSVPCNITTVSKSYMNVSEKKIIKTKFARLNTP